jgi:hypothetical protein
MTPTYVSCLARGGNGLQWTAQGTARRPHTAPTPTSNSSAATRSAPPGTAAPVSTSSVARRPCTSVASPWPESSDVGRWRDILRIELV